MMKYHLAKGIFLVKGAKNGALLDTNTKSVYSINSQACKVLEFKIEDELYWQSLQKMGLAELTNIQADQQTLPKLEILNELDFVWFEIVTDDCNERCIHCYADSMPKTYRKLVGVSETKPVTITEKSNKRMTYTSWLEIIRQSFELGCRRCQFIGGEPFLYKGENGETVLDLAEFAVTLGYSSVEIYTNGTLLTNKKIERIRNLGIKIATSLYSNQPQVHNAITRTPGSYAKTIGAIKRLREKGVHVRAEIVVQKENQKTVDRTIEFRKKLSAVGKRPDVLRPKGRGNTSNLEPDFQFQIKYGLKLKPDFVAVYDEIMRYYSGHPCLLGKVVVNEFGDVLPCIFSRNQVCGNYFRTNSLEDILLQEKIQHIWHITKDNVMVCRDCEYRYVCFDCRPLSDGAANGYADFFHAPPPRCTYNPYTGEWQGGIWKVNDQGETFYDRSLATEIAEFTSKDLSNSKVKEAESTRNNFSSQT